MLKATEEKISVELTNCGLPDVYLKPSSKIALKLKDGVARRISREQR